VGADGCGADVLVEDAEDENGHRREDDIEQRLVPVVVYALPRPPRVDLKPVWKRRECKSRTAHGCFVACAHAPQCICTQRTQGRAFSLPFAVAAGAPCLRERERYVLVEEVVDEPCDSRVRPEAVVEHQVFEEAELGDRVVGGHDRLPTAAAKTP
jgi:hypothetical protein